MNAATWITVGVSLMLIALALGWWFLRDRTPKPKRWVGTGEVIDVREAPVNARVKRHDCAPKATSRGGAL